MSPGTVPKSGGTKVRTGPALEVTASPCSGSRSGGKVSKVRTPRTPLGRVTLPQHSSDVRLRKREEQTATSKQGAEYRLR